MNINITGRKTVIKDSFRDSAEKKLKKFDRFFDDDATANVTVTNESGRETVEITVRTQGMIFRGEKTTDDRVVSLDLAADLLFKQIVKNKGKLEKKFKKAPPEFYGEPAMPDNEYKIARIKTFEVRPMAVDEAILQMELLGHTFFMFMNGDSGTINVVYKRDDGDYALIQPDM